MAFRRRKRLRGAYRSGVMKKSKKKIIIRLLFVFLCAAALTGAAILLGAYLGSKAEPSESIGSAITGEDPVSDATEELYPGGIPSVSDADTLEVFAADIDITVGTRESIFDRISALDTSYNTVSVRLTEDGRLVYVSPALLSYIGVSEDSISGGSEEPPSTESEDNEESPSPLMPAKDVFDNLKAVTEAAKAAGLRLSAVYTTSPELLRGDEHAISEIAKEKVIIGEILSLGFDEIMIGGLVDEEEDLSHEKLRDMINYLGRLREVSGKLDIGVTLPASVYMIHQTAGKIKNLSDYADFLAIGISTEGIDPDEAHSDVYETCYSLKGNFSVYNIRGLIKEEDADIAAAVCDALKSLGVKSLQFTVYNASPSYSADSGTNAVPEETKANPSNENAFRAEDYSTSGSDDPL